MPERAKSGAPFTTTRPPLPPVDSSRGGRTETRNSANLKFAPVSARRRFPAGASSVVVYIPNGSDWSHRNFVGIFEKNHQVGYRCLAESPTGSRFASNFGNFVRRFVRQFGRGFAPPLEPLWHSARCACPGSRIFSNLAHPPSEHKELDRAPCKR